MHQTVIIKGNKYGLSVYLEPEIPMEELLGEVAEKFRDSAKFFRGAKMAVSFEGRDLTPEETNKVVNTICENAEIDISCVIDTDKARETFFKRMLLEEEKEKGGKKQGAGEQFYKGTLRSGQILESEGHIVILGDVNPGARIVAKGNIVVLGALRGTAIAGLGGKNQAVVVALEMAPIQIRIGDVAVRLASRQTAFEGAKIAYLEFGKIYIEPLCKDLNLGGMNV